MLVLGFSGFTISPRQNKKRKQKKIKEMKRRGNRCALSPSHGSHSHPSMAASALLRLLSPSSPASLHARATRRRHPRAVVRCSSPSPASLDLPLLPFQPAEVLIPSECKTLHLYEARYLALLEEVERLDIGALVSIRGVCRVNIINLLQVPEDEPLQTNIKASLLWSEKEIFEEYNEGFIPALPERLSFAAYQTVSDHLN
uniref:Lon N-terminal domain-containing protein n=1 Tax=Oryza meridionalis TaxID=40149 RepID=A0A0E0F3S4_9ORYZ